MAKNGTISLGGRVYSLRLLRLFLPRNTYKDDQSGRTGLQFEGQRAGREVRIKYKRKSNIFAVRDPKGDLKWRIKPKGLTARDIIGWDAEGLTKINSRFSNQNGYPLDTTL